MKENYDKLSKELKERFSKIRLLALDFDGVLTDNAVKHYSDGSEFVIRSKADSLSIDLLQEAGLYDKEGYKKTSNKFDVVVISLETNPIVKSVTEKIKIKCTPSLSAKPKALEEEIKKRCLDISQVCYVGNDLNDMECMKKGGISVAVADAYPQIIKVADYVTHFKGGHGAVREVCELILYAKNKHPFP